MAKGNIITNNFAVKFVREAYQELRKVVWPKRKEVYQKTAIVVASIIIIAALAGALDYGLSKGIEVLISINK